MRGMKTARAIGEIDEKYIIEAAPEKIVQVKTIPWKYIAAASCIALVFCVGFMALMFGRSSIDAKSEPSSAGTQTTSQSVTTKPKSEIEILPAGQNTISYCKEFILFDKDLNSTKYKNCARIITGDEVQTDNGQQIDFTFAASYDASAQHKIIAMAYPIKDVSTQWVYAVQLLYEENDNTRNLLAEKGSVLAVSKSLGKKLDDRYFLFARETNEQCSLGQYMNALGKDKMYISSAYVYQDDDTAVEYKEISEKTAQIFELLQADKTTPDYRYVGDLQALFKEQSSKNDLSNKQYLMQLKINHRTLGENCTSIMISKDGYMVLLHDYNDPQVYFIGQELKDKLLEATTRNDKGVPVVSNDEAKKDSFEIKLHNENEDPVHYVLRTNSNDYCSKGVKIDRSMIDTSINKVANASINSEFNFIKGDPIVLNGIKGISPNFALASKDSNNQYYIYFAGNYAAPDLAAFMKDAGITDGKKIVIRSAEMENGYTDIYPPAIWDILTENAADNKKGTTMGAQQTEESYNCRLLFDITGYVYNCELRLYDNGEAVFFISNQYQYFNIGTEKVNKIKEYIRTCKKV